MAMIYVFADRTVDASAKTVYGYLADMREHSSLITTFTVTPQDAVSRVQIATTWDSAAGIGGFFERLFAPRVMRGIYAEELKRLNAYACQRATADDH